MVMLARFQVTYFREHANRIVNCCAVLLYYWISSWWRLALERQSLALQKTNREHTELYNRVAPLTGQLRAVIVYKHWHFQEFQELYSRRVWVVASLYLTFSSRRYSCHTLLEECTRLPSRWLQWMLLLLLRLLPLASSISDSATVLSWKLDTAPVWDDEDEDENDDVVVDFGGTLPSRTVSHVN